MANIPRCNETFYDGLAQWEDGTLIMCASSLTGKYWSGSLWCFKNVEHVKGGKMEKCITGVETDSGPCDIVALPDNRVLIGLDTGAIEILSLEPDPVILNSQFYGLEHDDSITSVDLLADKCKAVSGSNDFNIKVWDLEAFCSEATFRPAHADIVTQVAACPDNPSLFLSSGEDFKVKLWDLRAGFKACIGSCVISQKIGKIAATSVAWKPESMVYAVGTENGEIILGDLRNIPDLGNSNSNSTNNNNHLKLEPNLNGSQTHNRRITKLRFNPKKPKILASCANNCDIIVTDISNMENPVNFFKDSSHDHVVRDLLWDLRKDDELISCSWDKSVRTREIKNTDSQMETSEL